MTSHYKNTVLIAHNAKGFHNYSVLNALIDRHGIRPDKILYNGSKIMYMHVAKKLDLLAEGPTQHAFYVHVYLSWPLGQLTQGRVSLLVHVLHEEQVIEP